MTLSRRSRFSTAFVFVAFVFVSIAGGCSSSPSGQGSGGAGGSQDASPSSGSGGNPPSTGSGGSGGAQSGAGGSSSGGATGTGGSPIAIADGGDNDSTPSGDAATDSAAAACPYMFCADFENETSGSPPDPTKWTQDGTTVIVDGVKPHQGALGLHVLPHVGGLCSDAAPNCPAARFVRLTDAFPQALHKQHYGRMYFYINQTPTDKGYYHWMVMEANASTRYAGGLAVRQGGEMPTGGPVANGMARNYMLTHLDIHNRSITPYETDRGRGTQDLANKTWYCLEWFIDATNNKARYWLNNKQIPQLDWDGPVAGQPQFTFPAEFKSVAFGLRVFQVSTMQFEAFIDDIALDSKQIGCN